MLFSVTFYDVHIKGIYIKTYQIYIQITYQMNICAHFKKTIDAAIAVYFKVDNRDILNAIL